MIKILLLLLLVSTSTHSQNSTRYNRQTNMYKFHNYTQYTTQKIPTLANSDGMLKNLDYSYWTLKFYSHPDMALYNYIDLSFENNAIYIKVVDFYDNIVSESAHHLTPMKMLKPNEGIFAYSDIDGQLQFVYLHLLLEYLLAVKIVDTYEEAEALSNRSLTELGIFTLR